ncbi:MAG: MBL fold metallo-hydrolase [Thiohalophilus sp.]|uniref:MBL fold metallo-hydrolase n=1 Tax=Thiohalophilus sp. TaxID=3028392 RepID=UPI0028708D61|nr:MBL fold metallo-hydrolase [Thiohalophilus sp.]MDR9435561.1 MBL fold metallo-hydrolase [Thiohalophilus sp.]
MSFLSRTVASFTLLLGTALPASAANNLELVELTDSAYAIVGELGNRSTENLGNNATFGFIVTQEGVVLIDPGAVYQGAEALHEVIRTVTDKPVSHVINTGGQDHRWMGNDYFKQQGATIIASARAVEDQKARTRDQFSRLAGLMGSEAIEATRPVYADKTFERELTLTVGGTIFELRHPGQAHTPGDSFVWLPDEKILFTGDIVYTERMLSIGDYSSSQSWVESFRAMAAYEPEVVVPGHGAPTTLEKARADTLDYLVFLRETIREFMDNGGDITRIGSIDQSQFDYLKNFDALSGRNAQRVYSELEWE